MNLSFENQLLAIFKRPGMYMIKPSLTYLDGFIQGWIQARLLHDITDTNMRDTSGETLLEFSKWLAAKLGPVENPYPSWFAIDMSKYKDEHTAFNKAKELFLEFWAEKNR